jgi:hypothetical protein
MVCSWTIGLGVGRSFKNGKIGLPVEGLGSHPAHRFFKNQGVSQSLLDVLGGQLGRFGGELMRVGRVPFFQRVKLVIA